MVTYFNENRRDIVIPGTHMVVDESMSAWKGQEGKYSATGIPHATKIQRKPEGIGAEIKCLCDGDSNIMLALDIMEGKQAQRLKKYYHLGLGEGTAVILRLCENWFPSGRVIHADSAFSSTRTAIACLTWGLHFMGTVKTASREFPKKYLQSFEKDHGARCLHPRGGFKLMKSSRGRDGSRNINDKDIFGLAWYDKRTKFLISTVGTTIQGEPSSRPRHSREVVDGQYVTRLSQKKVPRPMMIQEFFDCFSNIDVHNHYRQGSLAMEKSWKTHKWYHRIFTTVFGMCVVDAFYAWKYECHKKMEFTEFTSTLAHELVHNLFLNNQVDLRRRAEAVGAENEVCACFHCG